MPSQLLVLFLACVNNQDYLHEDTWKKVAASLEDLYQSHRFVRDESVVIKMWYLTMDLVKLICKNL